MSLSLRSIWMVALVSSTATLASANVHIVAPSGGDYTTIQAAIDASADGDVILVKSGTYPGFIIVNRDLEIVEDYGQTVFISGAIRVRNLSADRDVLIDGLEAHGVLNGLPTETHGLFATHCSGSIRIQDCSFRGQAYVGFAAVRIELCSDIVFMNSILQGESGNSAAGGGAEFVASNVVICSSDVIGGSALTGVGYGDGGDGLFAVASYVFAAGSTARGGAGETYCPVFSSCADGGDGGTGVLASAGSVVETVETSVLGGPAGFGCNTPFGICSPGNPGQPFVLTGGSTAVDLPYAARTMSLASPLRELTSAPVTLMGRPGDLVYLAMTRGTHFAFDSTSTGVQVFEPGPVTRFLILGQLDVSTALTYTLDLPDLGPGVAARTQYMQAIFRDVNGQKHLGAPRAVVVLDSAY